MHVEALETLARGKGLSLDGKGLRQGRKRIAAASEEAIYRGLGLPFIPPELREGPTRSRWRSPGKLPQLVTDADLRGILHAHTDPVRRHGTLEAMAEATRERGYRIFRGRRSFAVGALRRRAVVAEIDEAAPGSRPAQQALWQELPHPQGHRIRHPRRRLARLSRGRCSAGSISSSRACTAGSG